MINQGSSGEALIVTALLPDDVQARFDKLRRLHFPRARNHLDAHVTLFHALPVDEEESVKNRLAVSAGLPTLPVAVTGPKLLGSGVAYRLESDQAMALRHELADEWSQWLTPQDRQKAELHVTVQNKADPQTARLLHAQLVDEFEPFDTQFTGLGLWRYMNGPWQPVAQYLFRGDSFNQPSPTRHRAPSQMPS